MTDGWIQKHRHKREKFHKSPGSKNASVDVQDQGGGSDPKILLIKQAWIPTNSDKPKLTDGPKGSAFVLFADPILTLAESLFQNRIEYQGS
jgi:hypothetical protein